MQSLFFILYIGLELFPTDTLTSFGDFSDIGARKAIHNIHDTYRHRKSVNPLFLFISEGIAKHPNRQIKESKAHAISVSTRLYFFDDSVKLAIFQTSKS